MKTQPTILCVLAILLSAPAVAAADRPNILFISVDDMNCDSMGVYGCPLPATPTMDALAKQSLRFQHAHVQVGNCMPSRNVMFSGRYPHNNRVEGFYQVRDPGYPVLCDLMKAGGYFTGIRGKASHSTPYQPYAWNLVLDTIDEVKQHPKDPASYFRSTKSGIAAAQRAKLPFCLLINISDPHKPFYGMGKGTKKANDPYRPSRVFTADEVPVPGFLPDTPVTREELALYYSTVRRADDCLKQVLKALSESGEEQRTFVVFLSDHGMPLPFAKTALYHHSTHTPWLVRWPSVTKAGAVDDEHVISAIDLLPTLLDVAEIEHPQGLEGRSIVPLLRGQSQDNREFIFKVYNENSGGSRHPMRGVQSKRFGYLFNPWSDGKRVFKTATTGTATYREMRRLAATDEVEAARLDLFDHRVVEEFYDYENDPDGLYNAINSAKFQAEIQRHREALQAFMKQSGDHALDCFERRDDPQVREAYMAKVDAESQARRANRRRGNRAGQGGRPGQRRGLIKLTQPAKVRAGAEVTLEITHQLPPALGKQSLHVTLKREGGKRVDRKVLEISGAGKVTIKFAVPGDLKAYRFAAFVGASYEQSLQHLQTEEQTIAP